MSFLCLWLEREENISCGLKMFLLLSFIIAGITAEESPVMHYCLKNSSICLHIQNPPSPPYQNSQWSFAGKVIASSASINPDYRNKVDYDPENLTLCVHNLTETDSGIYEVSFYDSKFNVFRNSHKVIVQEAVPTPVIRMSVQQSNLSAALCNVTVNCSIQGDWVWSVCDDNGCKTSSKSLIKVNISIYTEIKTVVCSGNNYVSMSNVSENIPNTCLSKSNLDHEEASPPPITILFIIPQTSNAELTRCQSVETGSVPRPRVSTSSSQADVTYENVDGLCDIQPRNPTIRPNEESCAQQSQTVDTVYSVLQAPVVTQPQGKSDSSKETKGHKETQEALESVRLDEAEQIRQIDTVYSVLKKPKSLKSQHHQQAE
ncbi:uncharacterized protein si:ch1073-220m6.1 [Scomber japonicus]|uniref:uncharacterized protein si:ch1073-220m6.1 n=1 Tax=Scomber japonicus TaxID=13676 RepID=UPI002305C098|nr:uncharacterized protein si:ch1073-220m6.1 [Scomber japonicus]